MHLHEAGNLPLSSRAGRGAIISFCPTSWNNDNKKIIITENDSSLPESCGINHDSLGLPGLTLFLQADDQNEGEDLTVPLTSSAHHLRLGPEAHLIWRLPLNKNTEKRTGQGNEGFTRAHLK